MPIINARTKIHRRKITVKLLVPVQVYGHELKVGDIIEVWFSPNAAKITKLAPYDGPLAHLFPEGARLADLDNISTGMTIDNAGLYWRLPQNTSTARRR